jgi:hypothetical protein
VADSRRNAEALVRITVCAPVGHNQVLPMLQGLAQGVGGHIDLVSDDRCVIVGQEMFPRNEAGCGKTGGSSVNLASACGAWMRLCWLQVLIAEDRSNFVASQRARRSGIKDSGL